MAVAGARERLRGKRPKLTAVQRKYLLSLYDAGEHTQSELFSVSRTTVYGRSSAAARRRERMHFPPPRPGPLWAYSTINVPTMPASAWPGTSQMNS